MKCIICKTVLKNKQRKYCSEKCNHKSYYNRHKDKIIKKTRIWEKNNKEKVKEYSKKSMNKFRTNKKERFNKLMMDDYYRNKTKWTSRRETKRIIKLKKTKTDIKFECNKCKSKENLSLKFEIYPTKAKEIREAIKNKKIYYICKGCRFK